MTTIPEKLAAFFALKPIEFTVLKSITVTQGFNEVGVHEQNVALILTKEVDVDRGCLHLNFHGARNFRFSQSESSVINITLVIREGSSVPHVTSEFFVCDEEQDNVMRLECRDFDVMKT